MQRLTPEQRAKLLNEYATFVGYATVTASLFRDLLRDLADADAEIARLTSLVAELTNGGIVRWEHCSACQRMLPWPAASSAMTCERCLAQREIARLQADLAAKDAALEEASPA